MSAEFDERGALIVLAALADQLADPSFSFSVGEGDWSTGAHDWLSAIYRAGWIRSDIDWPKWGQTQAARTLRTDPHALAAATVDDLAKLLTLLVRGDRFNEGMLHEAHVSGLLHRISTRAASILSAPPT